LEIFLPESEGVVTKEYVATVDVWHLGLGYNMLRLFKGVQKLYVFTN
jgi:hypothetical protein